MVEIISMARRLGVVLGILLSIGTVTVGAADTVYVWEVVTTYRKHLENGRLQLMSDGKTDQGLEWTFKGNKVDFGREGDASPRADGAFFKGNWIGNWHLNARVLMSHTTLLTEPSVAVQMPEAAGESMIGTSFPSDLKDSIVDLWEFIAFVPKTNQFIRLTCSLTSNNLVLDGDRKIGTYEVEKRAITVKFVDPKFGEIEFKQNRNKILAGRTKTINRQYWDMKFVRVQKQAVYRTEDNDDYILYTNNRVNSPVYTEDYWTTFNWYFYIEDGKRRLAFRSKEAQLSPDGSGIIWNNEKMILIAGQPPR